MGADMQTARNRTASSFPGIEPGGSARESLGHLNLHIDATYVTRNY